MRTKPRRSRYDSCTLSVLLETPSRPASVDRPSRPPADSSVLRQRRSVTLEVAVAKRLQQQVEQQQRRALELLAEEEQQQQVAQQQRRLQERRAMLLPPDEEQQLRRRPQRFWRPHF